MAKRTTKQTRHLVAQPMTVDEATFVYGMGFVSSFFDLKRELAILRRGSKVLQRAVKEGRQPTRAEIEKVSAFFALHVHKLGRDWCAAEERWQKLNGLFYADPDETKAFTDRHVRRRRLAAIETGELKKAA